MEQIDFKEEEQHGLPRSARNDGEGEENEHAEAVALVEKHRDFFEHYAKGKIKIEPAPADLKTFAFSLETNTIYVNTTMFKKIFGFTDEKTIFLTLHEIEHFLEKIQILSEEGGEKKFDRYLKRLDSSKAFFLMDNCVADIREYRALILKTNKGMEDVEKMTFEQDLFAETDFTELPRHIQFNYALLREARVAGEKCQVSADVRAALDEVVEVKNLVEVMTDPNTPMSMRLRLQDKYIWPKVEALLEKDMEDKKKEKEEERKEKEKKENGGDKKDEKKSEKSDKGQDGLPRSARNDEGGEGGEEKDGLPRSARNDEGGEGGEEKDGLPRSARNDEDGGGQEETDPNKIFAEDYAKVEEKFPEAVPVEEIEKALKEWKEAQAGKDSKDKADEDYAKKIGVEKKDLQDYRKIVENLEKIANPETDVGVIEELRNLFSRIISKRLKKALAPKYPVDEGDELVDPAQLISDFHAGNLQSKAWEDTEIKEKKGDRFGEVEITLVCDRSGSMKQGEKAEQQRKATVLVMEVLKEFAELCEAERINVDKPLEVKSEIYGFGAGEDGKPMKNMSIELGEAERISVFKKLYDLPGTTTDFNCLEAIDVNMADGIRNKIKIGELKKIVIVFTDGGSDDSARVQGVLKSLRDSGVVAIGVGITSAGSPALTTYAPNALLVEDVSRLPIVLGELLKEHLKDI